MRAGLTDFAFCLALAFLVYAFVFDQAWGEQIIRTIAAEIGRVHFFH